jgi:Tfp pilus assembly protein PilN
MIKVNLLRTHTGGRKKMRAPTMKLALPRVAVVAVAMIVLVAGGLGAWWYLLSTDIQALTVTRDELRIENARLQELKRQLDEFEKKKQDRQARIDLIEQLRAFQTGPVLLLNHVIQSIPGNAQLWLTLVEQRGDRIEITGHTTRGETLPDFMSNLSDSGYFRTVDLELFEDQQKESAKFTLVCITTRKAPTE